MSERPSWSIDARVGLGDFQLEVAAQSRGPVTALLGPSGSGKTTFLGLLSGLVRPDFGRVEIAGRIMFDSATGVSIPTHQRPVGMVFQDIRLFPHLTVADNLTYGRRHSSRRVGGPLADLSLAEVTALLALDSLLDRRPASLSGGEAQRVALGRALLSGPEVLLLDEPLTALDVELRDPFLRFLERVRDEVAVPMVYVSHNLPEVARLTGEAVVLRDGKVTATGTFADLAMDGPLAQRSDLVNALRVEVVSEDRESGTVEFALLGAPDVRIVSPQRGQDACRSTVFVRPSDVALALAPVTGISIRNQLPGRVRRLVVEGACARVEIDVGQPLVVELTRASAQLLGLEAGSSVVCLIKSRAVTR